MATAQQNNLFGPPQPHELESDNTFAPPSKEELGGTDTFAPPAPEELGGDKPAPDFLKDEDFQRIGQKHGVDPKELRDIAPYYGARVAPKDFPEAVKLGAKGTVGFVGAGPLLNIPQFVYKKLQNENTRKALDELQGIAQEQKSPVESLSEMVTPGIGIPRKLASTAIGRLAGGAGLGALAGAAGSPEGQESEGAKAGAAFGGGLGLAGEVAGKLLSKSAPEVEKKLVQGMVERDRVEIDRGAQDLLAKRQQSENDIEQLMRGSKELDHPTAQRIVREQMDPDSVSAIMSPSSEEGELLRNKLTRANPEEAQSLGLDRAVEKQLAQDIVDARTRDFAEYLTKERPAAGEEAIQAIKEFESRQGTEAVASMYKTFQEEKAAMDFIREKAVRGGRGNNFQDKALNFISDAQYPLRDIDERLGTNAEAIHKDMNAANNRMSYARNEFRQELSNIYKTNKAVDDIIVNTPKIYNALDTGNLAGLSAEEQKAVGAFRNYFDRGLDFANGAVKTKDPTIAPLSIPKRENYVPHLMKQTQDLVPEFESRIKQATQDASQLLGRPISDLSEIDKREFSSLAAQSQAVKDLLDGMHVFDAKAIKSGADLSAAFKDTFLSKEGRIRMATMAKAALAREGEVPMWMRETNLYRLADRWASNTLRHLYLRNPMDKLSSVARKLDAAGADLESRYIKNLLLDINGIRPGTMAEKTLQYNLDFQHKIDTLINQAGGKDTFKGGALTAAKALPELVNDMLRQIYPNMLGLSPRAMIMNATQTFTKTIPELGNKYGWTAVTRAAFHTLMNYGTQVQKLEKLGIVPAEHIGTYRREIADGIRRSALYAIPQNALKGMGEASMFLFQKLESLNRSLTLSTAEIMASDLARGSKMAQQALGKFPSTVRRQIAAATSTDEMALILAKHLNASTQYNYNRMSMSEWGRTMGPLFSTFSKWPTATAGDIIQELRNKGALKGGLRNAEKYIGPLVLLQMANYLITGGSPEEMSDRQKKLLGATGLGQAAPIGNLSGIIKGDFFTPPAIDAIVKGVVIPTMEGDPAKLKKGMASALQNFTPGSGYVRFLTDDLVTLITGRKPEGSDFLERSVEGARELGKMGDR